MSFESLSLERRLLKGVKSMGYEEPTPIQKETIPLVLAGKDVVGCAQTGTGKTAAFILPMLQRLGHGRGVRGLVVTPTRELALQIHDVARFFARFTGHRCLAVYGGVPYQPQVKKLRNGIDLLIATPGRLLDIQRQGDIDLGRVETLVLDEADRMLDMGFWPDVRRIIGKLPENRQNLLFSATMSPEVLDVIASTLHRPEKVEIGRTATPVSAVVQSVYPVNSKQKSELLIELIKKRDLDKVLVFTRTKYRADRVNLMLGRSGIKSALIHSNRSQSQRQMALDGFKNGQFRVLVATDIVARGIDVENISHVINFDMPKSPEDYVHRIGRTARAGAGGAAISFVAAEECEELRSIEVLIGATLSCEDMEGFSYKDRTMPDPHKEIAKARRLAYNGRARTAWGSRIRPRPACSR